MKGILSRLIEESPSPLKARNVMCEYLQARVLACLQREGAMIPLAFHGGTALRFLHSLPRHSEDLDFALEGDPSSYDLKKYVRAIETEFLREAYDVEMRFSADRTVQNAWIRFPGLLLEMGLSGESRQIFSLKIEVDTNPPEGARLKTTVVRRYVTLQLQHHDRSSLLAGKIHAILQRTFTKGRDPFRKALTDLAFKHRAAKLRTPHELVMDLIRSVAGSFAVHKQMMPLFRADAHAGCQPFGLPAFPSPLKEGVPRGIFYGFFLIIKNSPACSLPSSYEYHGEHARI